ncbi:DUF2178 domain-containing protein [Halorhabdus sp. BNX81]|uniref:DUF2178 domain-containing protein n=1 Tax=Halorhabdus sp. BNX81 TaxID=2980181 RepID=UPI0023DD243C|nr:DUF2178 domain-containing protein [Halorhabdus sp. BNX81]WEL22796.1 putative membrane protein [Halorhabdus sp. BNX81]
MTTGNVLNLTRQRYRGLVYGIAAVAILALLAGLAVGQHLAGTVVYMVGAWFAGGIAVVGPVWSDRTLQDERDYELHNRASGLLIGITMVVGLSVLPAVYVLDAGDVLEISGVVSGIVLTLSALFLLYGVCFGIVKRQY